MNIGQLDGQPLALQIFNGMTAESICVNERWAKDQLFRCVCFAGGQIKSTPSIAWRTLCFNPRPPCGGRPAAFIPRASSACISIHVLRVEDDPSSALPRSPPWYFNPRPPCGGRRHRKSGCTGLCHFNPRPPCGGRPALRAYPVPGSPISIHVLRVEDDTSSIAPMTAARGFQSTSSVWRTTPNLFSCAFA